MPWDCLAVVDVMFLSFDSKSIRAFSLFALFIDILMLNKSMLRKRSRVYGGEGGDFPQCHRKPQSPEKCKIGLVDLSSFNCHTKCTLKLKCRWK